MKQHWKILLWMLAGAVIGGLFQFVLEAKAFSGLTLERDAVGLAITEASGPAKPDARRDKRGFKAGEHVWTVILHRGRQDQDERRVVSVADFEKAIADSNQGDIVWLGIGDSAASAVPRPLALTLDTNCERAQWLYLPTMLADIFMALLKMLIVPLVLTSIVAGVAGVGALDDLRRLGLKTFLYYFVTSMLAIFVGQLLVNVVRPGEGAELGLPTQNFKVGERSEDFLQIFVRMVPENLFQALRDNSSMLQIIFFGLLFGVCITRSRDPHKTRIKEFFESAFDVMMRLAELVLTLIPYGVFFLLIKVVGNSGFGLFVPLLKYMAMIAVGLGIHGIIVLPLILKFFAKVNPVAWARTMGPALMTAFSASSSSMTLPVTMECVEKRGKVSNKTTSFVLPLGATINMDGTALYECAGVIFLLQYYASQSADVTITFGTQMFVVFMALFASVGAAGIPSAGLILMLTILSALNLPTEGAIILLAVDRPLDMLRTMVNVWSDSCGCAVIAKSEGEKIPAMYEAATPSPLP